MRILVDADGCPVVDIAIAEAKKRHTARLLGGQITHGWLVNAGGYPMERQSLKKLIKKSTFASHNELYMKNARAMLF